MSQLYPDCDPYGIADRLSEAERAPILRLRTVLENEITPLVAEYWEKGEFPYQIAPSLYGLNLMTPDEIEGAPRSLYHGFRIFELARTDASMATFYTAQAGLFRTSCRVGASPEQFAELDPKITSFETTGVFCLTEPDHGSDIAGGLATTAERQGDEWILNGAKRWIGGALTADYLAVFARDVADGQVKAFLVDREATGVTLEKIYGKTALRMMQNADTAQAGLFRTSCRVGASPEQFAELDPKITSFETTGVFCLTEPDHGSDIAGGLATTAERQGDEWILNGAKRWIGGALTADYLAVFARDVADGQVKAFLVDREATGVTLEKIYGKTALRMMQNADITLENVRVPEAQRLQNCNSFKDVAAMLRVMRSDVAWIATGIQAGAYEAALRYVRSREQFGKSLGSFQLVQEKLARMLGNVTASLSMVSDLAEKQDRGEYRDEDSALAKMWISLHMRETVALAREVVGGNGITLATDVARFHADAEAVYSYEGTHEINALVVGAYEAALRYVRSREQFGKSLGSFQLVQEKLARMLGNVTASLSMVSDLAEKQDRGEYRDEDSALAKMWISLHMRETVALAREVVGGNGITLATDVARFHADAEAVYSYEGTHEINALVVGRSITGKSAFA